jgi:hypothetical protein
MSSAAVLVGGRRRVLVSTDVWARLGRAAGGRGAGFFGLFA